MKKIIIIFSFIACLFLASCNKASNNKDKYLVHLDNGFTFYERGDEYYLYSYDLADEEITLPTSYNGKSYTIGDYAFYKNNYITSVIIPSGVTEIGMKAFEDCRRLKTVVVGNDCTTAWSSAFATCISLEKVIFGENVSYLADKMFYGCKSLSEVKFLDSTGWYKAKNDTLNWGEVDLSDPVLNAENFKNNYEKYLFSKME